LLFARYGCNFMDCCGPGERGAWEGTPRRLRAEVEFIDA
jgi:hypothetical protein